MGSIFDLKLKKVEEIKFLAEYTFRIFIWNSQSHSQSLKIEITAKATKFVDCKILQNLYNYIKFIMFKKNYRIYYII